MPWGNLRHLLTFKRILKQGRMQVAHLFYLCFRHSFVNKGLLKGSDFFRANVADGFIEFFLQGRKFHALMQFLDDFLEHSQPLLSRCLA